MKNAIYKLYANCILVKGYARSLILDLQREAYYFLPNEVGVFFTDGFFNPAAVSSELNDEDFNEVMEYMNYLHDKELVFIVDCDEKDSFPDLPLNWHNPAVITNCIIEVSEANVDSILSCGLEKQLLSVGCYNVELRIAQPVLLVNIKKLYRLLKRCEIFNLDLMVDVGADTNVDDERLKRFVKNNISIRVLLLFNRSVNRIISGKFEGVGGCALVKGELSGKSCGWVDPLYFNINVETYTESLKHNSCLNRKMAIDAEGDIKNCPSLPASYGNIKYNLLKDALNEPGFKKYWNITKDNVAVCRDCEFRYICTDCRAFVEDPEDAYSKPLKCGYSPYTTEWEDWAMSPLKQSAIGFYNLKSLVPNG